MSTGEFMPAAPSGAVSVYGTDIVRAARAFTKTPNRPAVRWRHQGRSHDGVDCIGLVVVSRSDVGLQTLDVADYTRKQPGEPMLKYCRLHMLPVALTELQLADILVMAYGAYRHMAIVADYPGGGLSIIHAHFENKQVVENRLDEHFLSRVLGSFRMPEVEA